jgi:hypothetical protein
VSEGEVWGAFAMNRYAILFGFLLCFSASAKAQIIKLKEVYRRTITADYIRYEYVFVAVNNTRHRLSLFADVSLLDVDKNVLDKRFIYFETAPKAVGQSTVESDYGPSGSDPSAVNAISYKLSVRDNALSKRYELEGLIACPIIHKRG